MTSDTDVTYETKTVRAVRGMESRTIKKWQAAGWEWVSQTPAKVQVEITFRRPRPKSRRLVWIIGGVVLVVVLTVVAVVGAIRESHTPAQPTNAAASTTRPATPSGTSSSNATSTQTVPPSSPTDVVLTRQNSPEFANVLRLTDYCSPRIAAFAAAHKGQTVKFPGSVGAIAPHGSYRTRYDILIGAGDNSETAGPAFQFRDENTSNDLHWVGPKPYVINVGTNLTVTATIDRYEERSCLFLLEPVTTANR